MNEMNDAVRLVDFRQRAADLLPEHVWNYVEGGAGDEHTVERNVSSRQDIELLPRVLVDASTIDSRVQSWATTSLTPSCLRQQPVIRCTTRVLKRRLSKGPAVPRR